MRKKGTKKASLTAGPEEKAERIKQLLPPDLDAEKNISAQIFKKYWQAALHCADYLALKLDFAHFLIRLPCLFALERLALTAKLVDLFKQEGVKNPFLFK